MIKKKSKVSTKKKVSSSKKNTSALSKLKALFFAKKSKKSAKVVKPVKKLVKPAKALKTAKKTRPAKAVKSVVKKANAKKAKVIKKVVKPVKKSVKKSAKKVVKPVKKNIKPVNKQKPAKALIAEKIVPAEKAQQVEPVVVTETVQLMHDPVLIEEVIASLELPGKKVIVDGTLGLGGHAHALLTQANGDSKLVAFELDQQNLKHAQDRLKEFEGRVHFIQNNFRHLAEELKKLKIRSVDAILLDLGLSSPHVDVPERGFSFLHEGPLDMRFDKNQELTAADVINKYSEKELARIFFELGEEMQSRKIAREIVRRRQSRSFKTTTELAHFIEKLIKRQGHIHPATRVFQALRIEVNKELESLQSVLLQAMEVLKKKGRLAVIAYHSLEDRIVKNFFKDQAREFINLPDQLTTTKLDPALKIVTKKPLTPNETELQKNPRSRSAKLRVAEKI